ncbi:FBX21 protein, partial [Chordeiles acutipennis]|nr:FBX21 protein [Chordeiles acutipennis]
MPHINAAAALQICVLLSALPAQYFISQWYGTNSAQRIQITERLIIASWSSFTRSYLSLDAWADRFKMWLSKTSNNQQADYHRTQFLKNLFQCWVFILLFRNWYYGEKKTEIGDSEAETHSYFAESTHVHSPKPEYIQFSVGQVIFHKSFGYSGVIVGWDVKARAPEEWLQHKYPPAKQDLKDTPHYRILINKANRFGKSTAYVPEEEITIIIGLEVVHHPDMKNYFSGYDGSKYIMQPWLKKIYPHD